jgi:hypothetical protein
MLNIPLNDKPGHTPDSGGLGLHLFRDMKTPELELVELGKG